MTIAGQTSEFLYSIALGACLGIFYDFFRILRIALPHKTAVVTAEDILFWGVCGFATFLFFLESDNGNIRMFLLLGELLGFILYFFTIGILVIGAAKTIVAVVRWIFCGLYRLLIAPVVALIRQIVSVFTKIRGFLVKYMGKQLENSNIYLQRYRNLLYNQGNHLKKLRKRNKTADENFETTKK